jgi:hypothetical protein
MPSPAQVTLGHSILLFLLAGCAAIPPQPPPASFLPSAGRWILAEHEGLPTFERERPAPLEVHVRIVEAGPAQLAEVRTIEVRVVSAEPDERHRFRIRAASPGVHLVDDAQFETVGRKPVSVRFTSHRVGRAAVAVERVDAVRP